MTPLANLIIRGERTYSSMPGRSFAFLRGEYVALEDAKISVVTHAFNYGTAVFEGIRANWNDEQKQFYLFRAREHFKRLRKSAHILQMTLTYTDDELMEIARKVVAMGGYSEDLYLRPMVYKSQEVIGVRLHDVSDDFLLYSSPFGAYLDTDAGIHCCTSTWRRVDDTGIPARAKVNGIYVNSALAKTEAHNSGYDEAIMLNMDGHVSEGSGENIYIINDDVIYTPPSQDNILVGITRATIIELAEKELGLKTVERTLDSSELYVADEVFMSGTAAHVTPVLSVDKRAVAGGAIGRHTAELKQLFFDAILGRLPDYDHWVTAVKSEHLVKA